MKHSLQLKFLFTFMPLMLAVVVFLSGSLLYQFRSAMTGLREASTVTMSADLLEQEKARGEVIIRLLAETLLNPLYHYDLATIEELLKATLSQENVNRAWVYDEQGRIIHDGSGDVNAYGTLLEDPASITALGTKGELVSTLDGHQLSVSLPIWLADKPLGGVKIRLSLERGIQHIDAVNRNFGQIVSEAIRNNLIVVLLTTALSLLIVVVVVAVLARRLTRPVKELAASVAQIGHGHYDVALMPAPKDEIGDLVNAFNQMKADLKASTISLDQLEKEVAHRTREITTAKEKLEFEIAERRNAEAQLKRYQGELEQRVAARTADLERSNAELKKQIDERRKAEAERRSVTAALQRAQKMEAIGQLAAGVAHDLNNILSGISSYPDLLIMKLPPDSHLIKPLTTIKKSGQKAAAIVQDLLTLARRGIPIEQVIDLREIVSEYLASPEQQKLAARYPAVRLETRFEADLSHIKGSPIHLFKSVMNLVANASEAMPEGGALRIGLANVTIDQPVTGYENLAEGKYVRLSVADEGVGISEADLDRIFEPFYSSKKMGRSGTGLGMAIVWGTVKDHGGHIDVQSAVGSGTTFNLYFPKTDAKPVAEETTFDIGAYRGGAELILVVDDVAIQREIACQMVDSLGYACRCVTSGEEAVAYLQAHTADLVLLDMIMTPGMDGLDTYRQIVALHPGQKAIIASGYSESDRIREAQALGAGAYIKKPYFIDQLAKTIQAVLRG
ncbi:MAG: ATP-binding protein [Desulfosarcinaceae bacterium]|nr:ATP-binding protein [Desulfosarcinaceae bacterium]